MVIDGSEGWIKVTRNVDRVKYRLCKAQIEGDIDNLDSVMTVELPAGIVAAGLYFCKHNSTLFVRYLVPVETEVV